MKRLLTVVILVCVFFVTVSCADNNSDKNPMGDEVMSETVSKIEKESVVEESSVENVPTIDSKKYYSIVEFDLPDDFREAAVDYMRKQSSVEWTPVNTFKTGRQNENWGFELVYQEGKVYTGLLYSTKKTSIDEFKIVLSRNNGKYISEKYDYSFALGVDCNTAITHSLQQFTNSVTGKAETLMPSYPNLFGGVIVGDYIVPEGARQTAKIISANSSDTMLTAYSQLLPGDIIITKDEDKKVNHLRMVVENPYVVTSAAGKINPTRSYIITIEQTDTFDKTRTDGVNTTWWVDHKYTFESILDKNYVPVSVEAYKTGVGVVPYIALDKEINKTALEKGVLSGTISSNYPIRFIHINLYGSDGALVNSVVFNGEFDKRSVSLRSYSVELFANAVSSTEYTLEVVAGVSRGSAQLSKVDFVYK